MGRNKHNQNVLPCISRKALIWDVENMRPWFGLELMMAQGFPKDLKLSFNPDDAALPEPIRTAICRETTKRSLTDRDLKKIAGNTMTIPIMGILQVAEVISTCPPQQTTGFLRVIPQSRSQTCSSMGKLCPPNMTRQCQSNPLKTMLLK